MADKEKYTTIIGAGIAGLSAGCYGQMNGYKTRIFETHTAPADVARPGNVRAIRSTAVFTG